jgi:hypothetical protein
MAVSSSFLAHLFSIFLLLFLWSIQYLHRFAYHAIRTFMHELQPFIVDRRTVVTYYSSYTYNALLFFRVLDV